MEVTKNKEQEGKKPAIDPAIIEELIKDYQRPEDLTGPGGVGRRARTRFPGACQASGRAGARLGGPRRGGDERSLCSRSPSLTG
jgi:hypothetical protein